jgi:hypothetical protein
LRRDFQQLRLQVRQSPPPLGLLPTDGFEAGLRRSRHASLPPWPPPPPDIHAAKDRREKNSRPREPIAIARRFMILLDRKKEWIWFSSQDGT